MIYILEDDDSIRKLVRYALESQGFQVRDFMAPAPFYQAVEESLPELVLLDIMLPEEDGLSILKKLRRNRRTETVPVIMLTAMDSEYDRAYGLDLGADDYITKPFGTMELAARVRAVLRRSGKEAGRQPYELKELQADPELHRVTVNGEEVRLTFKEFTLLVLLLEANGKVLTRDVLMDRVWGLQAEPENRTLDVHIRTLRAKLLSAGKYIETVRGVGYRMNGEVK